MRKNPHWIEIQNRQSAIGNPQFQNVVIRRDGAAAAARKQLTDAKGRPKFKRAPGILPGSDPEKEKLFGRRVIYASPLVDVAANMELVRETIDICAVILELTNWDIRLLSKSNLLPKVADGLIDSLTGPYGPKCRQDFGELVRARVIFGVSTGTLDDKLATAFEAGTPLVSKRIQSLHWLQDNGFRTFGMICPSLPQAVGRDSVEPYLNFAREMATAIRADRCEHVWAEVMNVRGESFTRTHAALMAAGYTEEAGNLFSAMQQKGEWEDYARATFEAHAGVYARQLGADGTPKLRFLQYVTAASKTWWKEQEPRGAILL
jgi:hypothetical protein